jgi:hypothetical protein
MHAGDEVLHKAQQRMYMFRITLHPFYRATALSMVHAGDVVFYNKMNKGVCKQMGATRSGSAVTASWSPCGRYLMTATTAPRLRVDNNVRVFNYVGKWHGW